MTHRRQQKLRNCLSVHY